MTELSELNVGDKVEVDGIDYEMTVESVCYPVFMYRYRCAWTASDGSAHQELFRREQLRLKARISLERPTSATL